MCKCTPMIRTPFCGRGDCLPPASREPTETLFAQSVLAENARLCESLNEALDWLKRLQEAYDPTDTEDGIVEIERLRKGGEGQ